MRAQTTETPPRPSRSGPLARLGQRLYVRIWLAVLLAVAVLTLLVGWAWQMASDPPPRQLIVRNVEGGVVGNGILRRRISPGDTPQDNGPIDNPFPPNLHPPPPPRTGPEFVVTMGDGQMLTMHLQRGPGGFWNKPPFGFFWTLGLVAVAVALATYPIIRKLTRRLERLQQGVESWGRGDLAARVPVQGSDEVAFLARRFNHAAERIETLVESHRTLLANASHELRSPLTRIRMGLELMGGTPSPAFKAEIARNIAELDQLIDEILLASRLDAQEADVGAEEAVDLTGLSAEECARVGAELQIDPSAADVEVHGVARLLRRAVRNLLENARRYSQGEIALILQRETAQPGRPGRAVLRVCDHGPGVPPDQREHIFEPFYRLPGASERDGGVGLGLALVRSIALRHGGTVRCEDRPDGGPGACFVLEMPLEPARVVRGAVN